MAYAELLPSQEDLAAAVLAVAGGLLTATWLRVNYRQRAIIDHVQVHAQASLKEFRDTNVGRPVTRLGSTTLMAVVVPLFLGAIWALFFTIAVA